MDPVTIAAAVGALLVPYIKKAAEAFAGEAGTYVEGKAKQLWERLRARVDPDDAETLDRFEHDPDDARAELEVLVERLATTDTALHAELAQALAEIKRRAPSVKVVQRVKEAEEAVAVRANRLTRGSIDVTQEADQVTRVTGVEINEIG